MNTSNHPYRGAPLSPHWWPATALLMPLVGVLVFGGCTVTEATPRAIEDYPPSLFETTTTTTEPIVESPEYSLPLYFVDGNKQLVLISRPRNDFPQIQDVLDKLNEGPSDDERDTTEPQIKSELVGLGLEPLRQELASDGLLTISVSAALRNLSADEADRRKLIVAQIMCSVALLDDRITSVQFVDEEGPVSFPGPDISPIDVATVENLGGCKTGQQLAEEAANQASDPPTEGDDEG